MAQITSSLSDQPEQRTQLKTRLEEFVERLHREAKEDSDDPKLLQECVTKIDLLELRLRLIDKIGEFSLLRLAHLEEIFRHYCTHVFRVGKHMTFDRLEYDRVHMTIERFFLFLRDFELTTLMVGGKPKEVVQKQSVITIFKKVSSNCRDLSFEEFIQCLQKLAVIYFDEKTTYFEKQEKNKKDRKRRKIAVQKRRLRRQKEALEGAKEEDPEEDEEEGEQKQDKGEQRQEDEGEPSKLEEVANNIAQKVSKIAKQAEIVEMSHENDDLVNQLLNDKSIEDPNDEVSNFAEQTKKESKEIQQKKQMEAEKDEFYLQLTIQEKIQFYYGIINVDSVTDYKHKLTELNLPLFKSSFEEKVKAKKQENVDKALSESKIKAVSAEEEERLRKIKQKMDEQKEKLKKKPLPKPSNQQALKQSENSRRRKELKREREQSLKQAKEDMMHAKKVEAKPRNGPPIKVEYKESEVSWQVLQKLSIDQLKLRQFNPGKMFTNDEDDGIFMGEYGGRVTEKHGNKAVEVRERQSLSVVENIRKRADQVQKSEKKQQHEIIRRVGNKK